MQHQWVNIMRRWLARDGVWLVLIFTLAVLAFAPALRNHYTLDDQALVQKLAPPHGLKGWVGACLAPWWPNHPYFHHWRPVPRTSILLQKALAGQAGWSFYAVNILLYAAICLLLYRVGRRAGMGRMAVGLGVLWFAALPAHAEVVHQIIDRCDLFVVLFMLAGLLVLPRDGLHGWRVWVAQPLLYLLALGSKDNGVLYPAVVFLAVCARGGTESAIRNPQSATQDAGETPALRDSAFRIPHSALEQSAIRNPQSAISPQSAIRNPQSAISPQSAIRNPQSAIPQAPWLRFLRPLRQWRLWALMALFGGALGLFLKTKALMAGGVLVNQMDYYENPLVTMGFVERLPAVLGLLGYAASRLVWPLGLAPDYTARSFPFERGWGWGWSWAGLALLALTALLMLRNFRRGGRGWLLAAAALGLYSIVSNGPIKIGGAVAPRFWFLPSAPACLGLGWALAGLYRKPSPPRRRAAALALAGVFASFVAIAWRDSVGWSSPHNFFRATLARFPDNRRGLVAMADEGFRNHDYKAGYENAARVTVLFQGDASGWGYRGSCAMYLPGRQREAEDSMRRALALDPAPDCWVRRNYAMLLETEGRYAEAARQLEVYLSAPAAADRALIERKLKALRALHD